MRSGFPARYGILLGKSVRPSGDIAPLNTTANILANKGGGVLTMIDSYVHNCLYGVWFNPYVYVNSTKNKSTIDNTSMESDLYSSDRNYVADKTNGDYRRVGTRNFVTLYVKKSKLYR